MKVSIHTIDGATLTVTNFGQATILDMLDALNTPTIEVMPFALDESSMTYILRRNIVRIDIDSDPRPPDKAGPPK